MKRAIFFAVVSAMLGINSGLYAQGPSQIPVIQIQKGTIIAFYTPAQKTADAHADSNEALSDFQSYAERVKQPLSKLDIDFKELYVRSFRLHLNEGDILFPAQV
jgi:hypothetical protein